MVTNFFNKLWKLLSKTLTAKLKKVHLFLIGSGQIIYVNDGIIGESGHFISDIIEVLDLEKW